MTNQTTVKRWMISLFGRRVGFERSVLYVSGERYLDRWIIYCGGTLRLHRFTRGDEPRALHDHPWWFITFPLSEYRELVYNPQLGDDLPRVNVVRPWRFHFRPALYRHRVLPMRKPIWTVVLTGFMHKHGRPAVWGFYPKPDEFIPHTDWVEYTNGKSLATD